MERVKNFFTKYKKWLIAILVFIVGLSTGIIGTIIAYPKSNTSESSSVLTSAQLNSISTDEVAKEILKKMNNHDMFVEDVGKVLSISNVKLEKNTDGINIYEVKLKYELSSLSAPIGKNYSGTSLSGTFYFAYDLDTEMWCKYGEDKMSDLTRWINSEAMNCWIQ